MKDWQKIAAGIQRAVAFINDNAEKLKDIFLTIHTNPVFGAEVTFGVIFSDRQDHLDIIESLLGGKSGTVERGRVPGRTEAKYIVEDHERELRFSWTVWTFGPIELPNTETEQVLIGA